MLCSLQHDRDIFRKQAREFAKRSETLKTRLQVRAVVCSCFCFGVRRREDEWRVCFGDAGVSAREFGPDSDTAILRVCALKLSWTVVREQRERVAASSPRKETSQVKEKCSQCRDETHRTRALDLEFHRKLDLDFQNIRIATISPGYLDNTPLTLTLSS